MLRLSHRQSIRAGYILIATFLLLACQLFNFSSDEAADTTPTVDTQATIAALATANSQLSRQVATVDAQLQMALNTATPTSTATPSPTATPEPSPTAEQLPPPSEFVFATTAPIYQTLPTATPTPKKAGWAMVSVMFSPKRPGQLYAFQKRVPDLDYRIVATTDFGNSWRAVVNHWPVEAECINTLKLDRHDPDYFYLNSCQGIYHWVGGGWVLKFERPAHTVANVAEQPQLLWIAAPFGATEIPVHRSLNSQTWTPASRYLDHLNGVATLIVDPTDSERLYAVTWPGGSSSYLRRGSTNGQWTTLPTPLNNSPIDTSIAIDGLSGALYVVTDRHQLWRSPNPNSPQTDALQWQLVHNFDYDTQIELLGAAWPYNELVLFINISPRGQQDVLPAPHYSTSGGKTWRPAEIE